MHVCHATLDDSEYLLSWRNDPAARAMFKNTDTVDHFAHLAWLTSTLDSPNSVILIGEKEDNKIGVVRFDRRGPSWDASINIAPEYQGMVHGYDLLRKGLSMLEKTHGSCSIIADVHVENRRSLRVFKKCNFVIASIDGDFVQLQREKNDMIDVPIT